MATGGLYGNASESVGLYGNTTNFGGSYFEWFIFYQSDTQPATPTGGSWSFTTNSGTPPTGWSTVPFSAPTLPVWVSIALVNSRSDAALSWSAPGLFSYSSGLPVLSGSAAPAPSDGINSQLYVQTSTTPQTIWFKQSGTWNRLVGSTLYADLTSAQTVAGIKTFSSPIVGSVTGTAANVTGIVGISNGGTGSTTASGARTALSAAASGANGDITSLTGLTTPLSISQGGTGATTANSAFNALAPSQTSQSGKYLTTDGTNTSWAANPLGTVTSVAVSGGTTGLTTSGGPITTSGTITLAGTLAVANGGTGVTTSSGANSVVLRDADSNITVNSVFEGYSSVAAAGTTTVLTASSIPSYVVTGSGGQTFQLPNATTLPLGALFTFNNNQSSGAITVNNASSTLVVSVPSGGYTTVTLLANGTSAGTWDRHDQTPANVSWSTNTFDYSGSITSATWNGATVAINRGGTGQTTANAAFNALAPSQTGNSGKYLTTDGSNTSWATNPLGTVTSVAATVPSFLSIAGSPITTSGTLAISLSGTALPTTSGGTGLTSFTSGGVVYASSSSALATGSALTFDGNNNLALNSASNVTLNLTSTSGYSQLVFTGGSSANYIVSDDPLSFYVGGSEIFRATSSSLYTASGINVAFGASSSATRLLLATDDSSTIGQLRYARSADTSYFWETGRDNNLTGDFLFSNASGGGKTERFRISANGNLLATGNVGIAGGAVPVASGYQYGIAVSTGGTIGVRAASNDYRMRIGTNFNLDGTHTNTTNNPVSLITMDNGTTIFSIGVGGSAGSAISYTSAMTLEADGDLALGKTSASYRFDLQGAAGENQTLAGFFSGTNTARGLTLGLSNGGTAVNDAFAVYNATITGGYAGHIWQAGGTEQARINQSGNLGIGTNNPLSRLHLAGSNTFAGSGLLLGSAGVASGYIWTTDNLYIKPNQAAGSASGTVNIFNFTDGLAIQFNSSSGSISVGGATATTSGTGITFPATQSASSNANTLDDYEEGTWTATLVSSGGGAVTLTTTAKYVKVGNLVFVSVESYNNSLSGLSAGGLTITGLPAVCNTDSPALAYFDIAGAILPSVTSVLAYAANSTNITLFLSQSTSANIAQLQKSDFNSNVSIRFNGTYTV
jgi:hypothetical protein